MNSSSKLWGPYFWALLHNMTILYPDNPSVLDGEMLNNMINSYKYLLPCEKCRKHFIKNLSEFPTSFSVNKTKKHISSKDGMILWGIIIHNNVNKMLDKNESVLSNNSGIANVKQTYKNSDTIHILKIVLKYIIYPMNEIDNIIKRSLSDLFQSVSYFLLYKNIDLSLNLKRKNVLIDFSDKRNILSIINNIQ